MGKGGLLVAAALIGALFNVTPAAAFKLVPIQMTFAPSGRDATQTFRLENDTKDPIAVEIHLYSREMKITGEDVLKEADDQFTYFPGQAVVQPGQSQALRVQWIGDAAPKQELAYRLIAEQLPVDIDRKPRPGGQMRLLVRYVASVYIAPQGVKPDVSVKSAVVRKDPDGLKLVLTVQNTGSAHDLLIQPKLTVSGQNAGGGSAKIEITGDPLKEMAGENILPGHERQFLIPLKERLAEGAVTAKLEYGVH